MESLDICKRLWWLMCVSLWSSLCFLWERYHLWAHKGSNRANHKTVNHWKHQWHIYSSFLFLHPYQVQAGMSCPWVHLKSIQVYDTLSNQPQNLSRHYTTPEILLLLLWYSACRLFRNCLFSQVFFHRLWKLLSLKHFQRTTCTLH